MFQLWGTPGSLTNYYQYSYDKLNRMLSGFSTAGNNESLAYDVMGNITALNRYQTSTQIDQLNYTYTNGGNTTNQLQSIIDHNASNSGLVSGTTNYTYDGNGSMLTQSNSVNTAQDKTVTYNLLNLPQTVAVANGAITYTYDALGTKMRKVSVISGTTKTTDYISGIEYDGGTTDTLNFITTEEGKAAKFGSIYDYQYFLGDNLGNTRVAFGTKTGSAVTYQKDDYYPFGMEINNSLTGTKNEYLYNKKELQEETQEYDYGARMYDPIIARWMVIDPLAEVNRRWSPYNIVKNNPIRLIDPDGMMDNPTLDQAAKLGQEIDKRNLEEAQAAGIAAAQRTLSNSSAQEGQEPDQSESTQTTTSTSDTTKKSGGGMLLYDLSKFPRLPARTTIWGINLFGKWFSLMPNREVQYDGYTVVYDDAGYPIAVKIGTYGVLPWYITGPGEIAEGLKLLQATNEEVQFGKTANQIYHATRHLEEAGLSVDEIAEIKGAIMKDVSRISKQIQAGGKVSSYTIKVNNLTVTYNAFRLPNGIINVGRIVIP